MRRILKSATRIELRPQATELDALLVETRLIQEHRPKWNVSGAFSFLYPLIGLKTENGHFHLCLTRRPERFPGFEFHGAFRSRETTNEAFTALIELLGYVGHPSKGAQGKTKGKKSYFYGSFRQIPDGMPELWTLFLKGESISALETLVLALIENAGARHRPSEIQDHINSLRRFYRDEARPLARAIQHAGYSEYPVPQKERDSLFLKLQFKDINLEHIGS